MPDCVSRRFPCKLLPAHDVPELRLLVLHSLLLLLQLLRALLMLPRRRDLTPVINVLPIAIQIEGCIVSSIISPCDIMPVPAKLQISQVDKLVRVFVSNLELPGRSLLCSSRSVCIVLIQVVLIVLLLSVVRILLLTDLVLVLRLSSVRCILVVGTVVTTVKSSPVSNKPSALALSCELELKGNTDRFNSQSAELHDGEEKRR